MELLIKNNWKQKDENKYNNNMFFGRTKVQKYKSTRVQRYKRNRRDRIDRSNKELQIQGIRFDETTKTYQQFENGPRVM